MNVPHSGFFWAGTLYTARLFSLKQPQIPALE